MNNQMITNFEKEFDFKEYSDFLLQKNIKSMQKIIVDCVDDKLTFKVDDVLPTENIENLTDNFEVTNK